MGYVGFFVLEIVIRVLDGYWVLGPLPLGLGFQVGYLGGECEAASGAYDILFGLSGNTMGSRKPRK